MTRKEKDLIKKAKQLSEIVVDAANNAPLAQDEKNKISDPATEVLSILGGLIADLPKGK